MQTRYGDVTVTLEDFVATVEIQRPPNNVLDIDLLRALATAFETLDNAGTQAKTNRDLRQRVAGE